jgi:G3E family GTPase
MSDGAIPVTILSGSLGAGKTTTVNRLLQGAGDRRVAVLVNDMGEVNVDADLLDGSDLATAEGGVAELSNGCICCELQDDFETEVSRLARTRDFDVLVVEPSGISEPAPIAQHFETGSRAAARYDVDAVVAVVDARQFHDAFCEVPEAPRDDRAGSASDPRAAGAGEVGTTETEDGEVRPLSDLLVQQAEFADVIVLNKCDLLVDDALDEVEDLLASLQPDAELRRAVHGDVDPDEVLETGLFDPGAASEKAGWKRALDAHEEGDGDHGHDHGHDDHQHDGDGHAHRHPDEQYGVTSFVYRRVEPLHPGRFHAFLADFPEGVVRAKGRCWVAGREDTSLLLGQAGPSVRVERVGPWIVSRPEIEQDIHRSNHPDLAWDDEWGDRRTELVFIGTAFDEDAIRAALDDCLLTEAEWDDDWSSFENPFPVDGDDALTFVR